MSSRARGSGGLADIAWRGRTVQIPVEADLLLQRVEECSGALRDLVECTKSLARTLANIETVLAQALWPGKGGV